MDDKVNQIIAKVGALYMKYGIRSVTMDDVARELGISKKTLYQYFTDKNALVRSVVTLHIEIMNREFDLIAKQKLNAIESMLFISDRINKFIQEFNPAVNYDLMKYHPDAWTILLEYKRERVFNYVKENLIRGMREGLYRKDLNYEVIARVYVSRIKMEMGLDATPMPANVFAHFFKEVISYHIRGIASAKGLAYFEKMSKEHALFQE
jgi:AcrR family transcriptional regulator